MKVTKEKLNQIIQEELASLVKEDEEIAAALMGKAGLPRSAQDTKVDKPITPKDLGPEDEPYTERQTVDIGDVPPTREFIIKAAEMLNLLPGNKSDENVIYNVAMYLQNIGGNEIDAVVDDARAEAEYIKADDTLEEGYGHEGSMARNQLGRTAEMAAMIQGMISDDTNLEEWVESKITKAQDYLSSVLNYMRGESLSEREMTDKEKEKRSDIAKDISTKDLQKRYGVDREEAEDIKYAIATKSAMGKKK